MKQSVGNRLCNRFQHTRDSRGRSSVYCRKAKQQHSCDSAAEEKERRTDRMKGGGRKRSGSYMYIIRSQHAGSGSVPHAVVQFLVVLGWRGGGVEFLPLHACLPKHGSFQKAVSKAARICRYACTRVASSSLLAGMVIT